MTKQQYVQYGCGLSAPKLWRKFDISPTIRFERLPIIGRLYSKNESRLPKNVEYGDIVKGLPITDGSCKAVYCSHILEHLSLEGFRKAVRNTFRILEKGGAFHFLLPDLEYSIKKYNSSNLPDAAITFMKETSLGKEKRNRGIWGFAFEFLSNSQHLWMWDYKSIERELSVAGFIEIRRAQFGDSSDSIFREV